ncbi:hypothetical protein HMPREF9056_01238 [Actinomyces sp. oral taxon 170 str. F0386]|nr:hypothetical protein HMPREF9056_01238 [Actinomyces sp. oral taxon 170 str. F0386]
MGRAAGRHGLSRSGTQGGEIELLSRAGARSGPPQVVDARSSGHRGTES